MASTTLQFYHPFSPYPCPLRPSSAFLHKRSNSFLPPSRRKLFSLHFHIRNKITRTERQKPSITEPNSVRKDEVSSNTYDLPYHANTTLTIERWGTIYNAGELGDNKSKLYWNSSRSYPYPIGYISTKTYKGRLYRQSIEEGLNGPVFAVEEILMDCSTTSSTSSNNAVFRAESPQKVWNKVVKVYDGHHVQGARHFGFQNPDVVRVLLHMVKEKEKNLEAEINDDVAGADDDDCDDSEDDGDGDGDDVDNENVYVGGDGVDNGDGDNGLLHRVRFSDDIPDKVYIGREFIEEGEEVVIDDKEQEPEDGDENEEVTDDEEEDTINEEDVINEGHEEEEQDDDDDDEDDDDDDGDDGVSNVLVNDPALPDLEEHPLGNGNNDKDIPSEDDHYNVDENFSFDNVYPTDELKSFVNGTYSPSFNSRAPFLNKYKEESNLNRSRKLDMVEESYKEDMGIGNPKFKPGALQKSVWRKGEGLTNRNQLGISRLENNQMNSYNGVQSRVSTHNGSKPLDNTFMKRREESSKSSHMLLELLQKWNNVKKFNSEEGEGLQGRVETTRLQAERNHSMQVIKTGDERASKRFSSHGVAKETTHVRGRNLQGQHMMEARESVLNELKQSDEIDESTDYAISRLFEAVGKKHKSTFDMKGSIRIGKKTEGDQRNNDFMDRGNVENSSNRHIGNQITIEHVDDNLKGMRMIEESTRVSRFSTKKASGGGISEEPKFSGSGENTKIAGGMSEMAERKIEERNDSTQLTNGADLLISDRKGAQKTRLLQDVKRLVGNKKYEDAISAIKHAKSCDLDIDEDTYEALMGIRLEPWQKEAFRYVQEGSSVLVSASGGSGKSVAADFCLYRNIIFECRTLFITPYDYLAKQKFLSLQTIYGPSNVGGIWARKRTYKGEKLIVLTLESLAEIIQELNGPGTSEYGSFFKDVNLVVLDKFHTFSEQSYNSLWEQVLMLMDPKISVIALTLPSSNEEQVVSWMGKKKGACKLIRYKSEPVLRRFFYCYGSAFKPLLDTKGRQLNNAFSESNGGYDNSMTKEQQDSFFWVGYDRPSLKNALGLLEENAMLPALLVFFSVKECSEGMEDALIALGEGLLSQQDLAELEASIDKLANYLPSLLEHIDEKELKALRKGFATCNEGKMPLWQNFVLDLFQKNILKLLIVTDNTLLHTGVVARTVILPATCKATKDGVHPIPCHQALQMFGSAGRRGYDIEGNVLFLENFYSGPKEVASLVLNNSFEMMSTYKPSYSLVANLVAKYSLSHVKTMLESSYHDFVYYATDVKNKKVQDLDLQILRCLEVKADMEVKLFQGLTEVNKQKLLDAAMFTRVDIRMNIHSASQTGSTFPAFLIACVPGQVESLYMVLGADNNFRLLPAGALDHVYVTEMLPLDILYKKSTGSVLQPPVVPPKDSWKVEHRGACGYVARGNSQTKMYVKLLMDYPAQCDVVREGLHLRREINILEAKISNLIEEKRSLLLPDNHSEQGSNSNKLYIPGLKKDPFLLGNESVTGSKTWKEALKLLNIMEKVDAISIVCSDDNDANDVHHAQLKHLGMLISRLQNVDNALWLAMVLTCTSMKNLLPAEFVGILATLMPSEVEAENLFNDPRESLYRITKPLKDVFLNLEMLRKQVAALQGSYDPPLHLNPAFGSMVYTWARGKPGTVGFNMMISKDGEVAQRLQNVMKFANLVSLACDQVSKYITEPNEFAKISLVARRAEEVLARHLVNVDRND